MLTQLLLQFLDLPTEINSGIEQGKENSLDFHAEIAILLDTGDCLVKLVDTICGKDPGRAGAQNIGSKDNSVYHSPPQRTAYQLL